MAAAAFPAHPRLSGVSRKPGGRLAPPQKGAEEAAAGGGTWRPPPGAPRRAPWGRAGPCGGDGGVTGGVTGGTERGEAEQPRAKEEKGVAARGGPRSSSPQEEKRGSSQRTGGCWRGPGWPSGFGLGEGGRSHGGRL